MAELEEQRLAHELVTRLAAVGIDATVADGRYVRASSGGRRLRVFCIWYEPTVSGLMLGMNPSNARSSRGPTRRRDDGAEYLVSLHDGDDTVATDRTSEVEQVAACADAWLGEQLPLAEVERRTPFVRALHRRASAIVATLDPALRCSIGGDPSYEVWALGDGRACKLYPRSDGGCAFLLGQAQIAFGELAEPSAAVSAWLVERVSVSELATRFGDVTLEQHAELIEEDPARWHWLGLLDRAADPDDVLAPLRELIEALALRPAVTAFYSFSSLFRLCFSASSHYPWANEGLPIVWRVGDAYVIHTYQGDGEPVTCELAGALALIEQRLTASALRPFFGTAT